MKKIHSFLFFLLVVTTLAGCRKTLNPDPQSIFVKLFPVDSSYKTGGCFQLADGNYIIYGFDPDIGGLLPLVIKTDQKGKIIWQRKLPSEFRYLTIKSTLDGNMLAIGARDPQTDSMYVCKIYSDSTLGTIWRYTILQIRVTKDFLPDFVEDAAIGFIICGSAKINTLRPQPFILHIDHEGTQIDTIIYHLTDVGGLNTSSICRNANGYSICGSAADIKKPFKGFFYLRLNEQFIHVWDTVIIDSSVSINASVLIDDNSGDSTVVCGSAGGTGLTGEIFTVKVDQNWDWDDTTSYNDYENEGKFTSICKTSDGGYILSGTVNVTQHISMVSYAKIYLLKVDANLKKEWSRQFNSTNTYTGVSAIPTLDGGYLVSGYEHTVSYMNTMLMIKTDAYGNIVAQ